MNLQTEKNGDSLVLYINEERLDAHNSSDLKDTMLRFLENGEKSIIVDLKEVRFIDSSGLGALLSGYKNANLHQGNLALSGLQSRVQSMFELTRLHQVFEIYPNTEEALGKES